MESTSSSSTSDNPVTNNSTTNITNTTATTTKGPPARLLARLGNPTTSRPTSSSTVNTITVPEPTDTEIFHWIKRNYVWRCAICCELQPVTKPNQAMKEYGRCALQRSMYQQLCIEQRIAPKNPPTLPSSVIPPSLDDTTLFNQICRDCGSNGLKTVPGIPSNVSKDNILTIPVHHNINFPLLKQLLKISFGGNTKLVNQYLQKYHIQNEQDILTILESSLPVWPETIPSNSSNSPTWLSSIPGSYLRQPRWGIQPRHPITCIGYSLHMLGHDDTPLNYADERTLEQLQDAKDNAEAEIMLSGPTFVPNVPSYPQMHPERPDRLRSALGYLACTGLLSELYKIKPRHPTMEEIELASEVAHYNTIMQLHASLLNEIHDNVSNTKSNLRRALQLGDTYINCRTIDSAFYALGTTIEAMQAVASGKAGRALAIVRPPGHHADCSHTQGFCIFNNVGGAIKVILQQYSNTNVSVSNDTSSSSIDAIATSISSVSIEDSTPSSSSSSSTTLTTTKINYIQRILIVDWDLHHGDGTEQMFYDNPNVLFISIHRYDHGAFYPGTGHCTRVGSGAGEGYNINIPLNGVFYGDADYLTIFDYLVMPIARAFSPDLVCISCGFDAARGDWLGDYDITPAGYAHMTYALSSLAQGKLVVVLEGGYNLYAIASSTEAITRVLLGENPLPLEAYDDIRNKVADEHESEICRTAETILPGTVPPKLLSHGIKRRTPKAGTWETIEKVINIQEKYWPVLGESRKALFSSNY